MSVSQKRQNDAYDNMGNGAVSPAVMCKGSVKTRYWKDSTGWRNQDTRCCSDTWCKGVKYKPTQMVKGLVCGNKAGLIS